MFIFKPQLLADYRINNQAFFNLFSMSTKNAQTIISYYIYLQQHKRLNPFYTWRAIMLRRLLKKTMVSNRVRTYSLKINIWGLRITRYPYYVLTYYILCTCKYNYAKCLATTITVSTTQKCIYAPS